MAHLPPDFPRPPKRDELLIGCVAVFLKHDGDYVLDLALPVFPGCHPADLETLVLQAMASARPEKLIARGSFRKSS